MSFTQRGRSVAMSNATLRPWRSAAEQQVAGSILRRFHTQGRMRNTRVLRY